MCSAGWMDVRTFIIIIFLPPPIFIHYLISRRSSSHYITLVFRCYKSINIGTCIYIHTTIFKNIYRPVRTNSQCFNLTHFNTEVQIECQKKYQKYFNEGYLWLKMFLKKNYFNFIRTLLLRNITAH